MAIRELNGGIESNLELELKEGIKAELKRPESALPQMCAPVVFRDSPDLEPYHHYYAVWNRFLGLNQEIRSSIVYQAILETFGKPEALEVTTAMGLTVEEAKSMDIEV